MRKYVLYTIILILILLLNITTWHWIDLSQNAERLKVAFKEQKQKYHTLHQKLSQQECFRTSNVYLGELTTSDPTLKEILRAKAGNAEIIKRFQQKIKLGNPASIQWFFHTEEGDLIDVWLLYSDGKYKLVFDCRLDEYSDKTLQVLDVNPKDLSLLKDSLTK